jgi:hypothetical protein
MAVGLLDARFEIRRDGTASFLRAERDVFEVKRNLLGRASDFVGRGREMSMLSNYFTSAIAEGTGLGRARDGRGRRRQVAPAPRSSSSGSASRRSAPRCCLASATRWAPARRSR